MGPDLQKVNYLERISSTQFGEREGKVGGDVDLDGIKYLPLHASLLFFTVNSGHIIRANSERSGKRTLITQSVVIISRHGCSTNTVVIW